MNYSELVKIPAPGTINTKFSPARIQTQYAIFGKPGKLTSECNEARAPKKVRALLETRDVGPFRLRGIGPWLDVCQKVYAEVKQDHPELYEQLVTAGCFCARLVRGSNMTPSNHTFGTATDHGVLMIDRRGDGKCQRGMLVLYGYFKKHGAFWGAGFRVEDAMHFEASDELLREWQRAGRL